MKWLGFAVDEAWGFHPLTEEDTRGYVLYFWVGPLVFEWWVTK